MKERGGWLGGGVGICKTNNLEVWGVQGVGVGLSDGAETPMPPAKSTPELVHFGCPPTRPFKLSGRTSSGELS